MVRSDLVVFPEPKIDGDLGLFGGMDPFSLEHLLSQGPLKALILPCVGKNCPAPFSNPSTFPRRARIDLHGFEANALHPRGGLSVCG